MVSPVAPVPTARVAPVLATPKAPTVAVPAAVPDRPRVRRASELHRVPGLGQATFNDARTGASHHQMVHH